MNKILIALVMSAAACGGGEKPAPTTPITTTPVVANALMPLGEASMAIEAGGESHELKLSADGKVSADGKEIATLTSAGEMMVDGKVVMKLSADGLVTDAEGKSDSKPITVRADGAVLEGDTVMIEVGADGALVGKVVDAEMHGAKLQVTGAPETRRALMFAWLGAMSGGSSGESHVEAESGTSPATP